MFCNAVLCFNQTKYSFTSRNRTFISYADTLFSLAGADGTYANNPKLVEPVSKSGRLELMAEAKAIGIPILQSARPLWEEWTPLDKVHEMAGEVAHVVDGVILGGILTRTSIKEKLAGRKVPVPPWDKDKGRYLDRTFRENVRKTYGEVAPTLPVFYNTSCAISFAAKIPHYMGFYGNFSHFDPDKYCQRPCHPDQRERCRSAEPSIKNDEPGRQEVLTWLRKFNAEQAMFQIEKGYINLFAWIHHQQCLWMRQHTGIYVYQGDEYRIMNHHPKV